MKRRTYRIFIIIQAASLVLSILSADAATYTYDSLSRIIGADYENGFIEEYTYDPAGSRLMITVTSKWISGNGHTSPGPGSIAEISVELSASSPEAGSFTYYYADAGISLSSISISSLIIEETAAVIAGECTLNSLPGYSFLAKLTDTLPDTIEIEIYNPDGTIYFSSEIDILISGDLTLGTESPAPKLTVSAVPLDGGAISPECTYGCFYESGTTVTITANESIGYGFIGWTGCDSTANTICIMTMEADRSAEAVFGMCLNPVRIPGESPLYYSSLQNAYDNSVDTDTIQLQDAIFIGNIQINRNISTVLQGGLGCAYGTKTGMTRLKGSITISGGTITIGNIVLE